MRALKNYFELSKRAYNGVVVLVILIVLVLLLPNAVQWMYPPKPINLAAFNQAARQLQSAPPAGGRAYAPDARPVAVTMFRFNPNHLPDSLWQCLGLSPGQIRSVKHYEEKGGSFKTRADVRKMYTLTAADYARLEPYIDLPAGVAASAKTDDVVELNTADSARLTQVHGIGPAFASRIISYRTQLGGFVRKEQLREVYGMDSARYSALSPVVSVNGALVKPININRATVDDLRRFPYLNFKQMNAIVEYRKQHGNYQTIADLHNIAILDAATVARLKPYIKFK